MKINKDKLSALIRSVNSDNKIDACKLAEIISERIDELLEWQPIETAPKGDRILVSGTEIGACVASAGWDNETPDKIRWEVVNEIIVNPTYWMPLPPPPETK